jgi:SAM-dependent methyltransferase
MSGAGSDDDYEQRAAAESLKWGAHLQVEARGEMNAWLDHPAVAAHYARRGQIDDLAWESWVLRTLGGPATCSLDLGCGSATRSLAVWEAGVSAAIEGVDLSAERVAEGERARHAAGAPGGFRAEDVNRLQLAPGRYDLIFSAHSFHHFLALEHVLEQVHQALTPRGLFVLEEFVGPTQFQWTDEQMALTRALLAFLPADLRRLRWGALKDTEGRPTVDEVVAVSPFESIRSGEIAPLFARFFDVVVMRPLGGTLQHLLYNGIAHNFWPPTEDSERARAAIAATEDALIDSGLLPSDFQLLIGRRRDAR